LAGGSSALRIEMEPYNWTDDMKQLRITTPEKGIVLKISITNTHDEYDITLRDLWIKITIEGESQYSHDIHIDYIYLPPGYVFDLLVVPPPFEKSYTYQNLIGEWSIKAEYEIGNIISEASVARKGKIEPYPFEFRVLSQEQFEKEIKERGTRPIINIATNITIQVSAIGGVSLFVIYYVWRKHRHS